MDYRHAYLNMLLLLHFAFMLSMVKMPIKGEVSGHGYYIFLSWKNHGILLNFCGNPVIESQPQILNKANYNSFSDLFSDNLKTLQYILKLI